MMYKRLMRIFFKENFSLQRLLGADVRKHKGKAILIGILILYGLGAFLFTFGFMFFDLGDVLNQIGAIDILLVYAYMYATILTMMFVLFRANGYLFNYKDYEILEPMPLKTRTVILAKLTVMLVFIYVSVFLFLSPILFSYFYHGGFDVLSLIFVLLGSLTIPLVPTIIFSFLSLLIARITSRFRKSNLLNIVLLFFVFIGIMYLSFSINSFGDDNPLLNQQGFMDNLSGYYPPIKWFMQAVSEKSMIDLLILLVTNAIVFAGFVFGIQKLVKSTNQRGLTKVTRINHKKAVSKQRSVVMAISVKEFKRFVGIPIYALNAGFGAVMLFVLGIASLFVSTQIQDYVELFIGIGIDAEAIVLLLICFSLGLVYSTAFSLSLEGKNFWILKSLPIKPQTVMHGKMLFNVLLGLPAAIIALILFGYSIQIDFVRLVVMILFTISLSFAVTVMGSLVNLYTPKFNFKNPTQVIKQSASAFLALIGSFVLVFINGLIYYFATKGMSFEIAIMLATLFNLIIAGVLFMLVNKTAESLFIKFEV